MTVTTNTGHPARGTRHLFDPVIGLEVHAQLLTASKMYCACSTAYADAPPNTHVCPTCLGMPGVLPLINEAAVRKTVMTALALHCEIPEFSKFDRKNYPYPDLMKGYQISQYDMPLSRHGYLDIKVGGQTRRIGVTRVHLEEDTAKLLHRNDGGAAYSLLDVNRAGVPLMEIVSEPDLHSPEEARVYFMTLRSVLQYLGVNNGDMEKGSLRCDVNVSLRPVGTTVLPSFKTEIKNINSFRAVMRALEYEIERQRRALAAGESLIQETRGWSEDLGETVPQRTKEYAHDYRYFPEPDLPPLVMERAMVEEIRNALPELADVRAARLILQYGLPEATAEQLTAAKETADYFEQAVACTTNYDGRVVANWVLGEVQRLLHLNGVELSADRLPPHRLAGLLALIGDGTLSTTMAKQVLEHMFTSGKDAAAIVREEGLAQVSNAGELELIVRDVMEQNPKVVADYRSGKTAALRSLMGKVMAATRGKADPALATQILQRTLDVGDVGG